MKRVVSIVLAVMLLTTGCSFIGQKDISDESETIIPAEVQTVNGESTVANASIADTSVSKDATVSVSSNSNTTNDTSSISNGIISGITEDIESNEDIIDNGLGKGIIANSDKNSVLITLYYRNKEGLLVPVTRKVMKQEGLAKAAISGLVDEAITREQLVYYGLIQYCHREQR